MPLLTVEERKAAMAVAKRDCSRQEWEMVGGMYGDYGFYDMDRETFAEVLVWADRRARENLLTLLEHAGDFSIYGRAGAGHLTEFLKRSVTT